MTFCHFLYTLIYVFVAHTKSYRIYFVFNTSFSVMLTLKLKRHISCFFLLKIVYAMYGYKLLSSVLDIEKNKLTNTGHLILRFVISKTNYLTGSEHTFLASMDIQFDNDLNQTFQTITKSFRLMQYITLLAVLLNFKY